jgi:nicotinamide-nucleotide amidase
MTDPQLAPICSEGVMTDDASDGVLASLLEGRACGIAESCTGGLVAQSLVRIQGSGDWFRGAVVTYQKQTKYKLLAVTPGPVVNARAAEEMARGAARLLDANVTVSVTGAAGPEAQDGMSPGTVFIATYVDGAVATCEYRFDGDPEAVCHQARDASLAQLQGALQEARHNGFSARRG